jgi:hypothetical protein
MQTYSYKELLLLKLFCASPECGKAVEKIIGEIAGRDSTTCPVCGNAIDLIGHKEAIDDLFELATELDKSPGK